MSRQITGFLIYNTDSIKKFHSSEWNFLIRKIIMRRFFVIFDLKNHENGNAVRRCLLYKKETFL